MAEIQDRAMALCRKSVLTPREAKKIIASTSFTDAELDQLLAAAARARTHPLHFIMETARLS